MYLMKYRSPIGLLYLAAEKNALTGLWIEGQKYFASTLSSRAEERPDLPIFQEAVAWLEAYFHASPLPPLPPLSPKGSPFRQEVWKLLLEIPKGQTTTYGALTRQLQAQGISASPQAVGGAVGHNPISILIPCHRVVGTGGSLTGYAGGLGVKRYLLALEGVDIHRLHIPESARKKFLPLPRAVSGQETPSMPLKPPAPGKYPCPCCGFKTFPVPKEDAIAYICPVCFWENDVFISSDEEPSDENHGMTLSQGREAYRKLGACRQDLLPYVRTPMPEEYP